MLYIHLSILAISKISYKIEKWILFKRLSLLGTLRFFYHFSRRLMFFLVSLHVHYYSYFTKSPQLHNTYGCIVESLKVVRLNVLQVVLRLVFAYFSEDCDPRRGFPTFRGHLGSAVVWRAIEVSCYLLVIAYSLFLMLLFEFRCFL